MRSTLPSSPNLPDEIWFLIARKLVEREWVTVLPFVNKQLRRVFCGSLQLPSEFELELPLTTANESYSRAQRRLNSLAVWVKQRQRQHQRGFHSDSCLSLHLYWADRWNPREPRLQAVQLALHRVLTVSAAASLQQLSLSWPAPMSVHWLRPCKALRKLSVSGYALHIDGQGLHCLTALSSVTLMGAIDYRPARRAAAQHAAGQQGQPQQLRPWLPPSVTTLYYDNFDDEGIQVLPAAVTCLASSLHSLLLFDHSSPEQDRYLAGFSALTRLTHLSIESRGLSCLPFGLRQLSQLQVLELRMDSLGEWHWTGLRNLQLPLLRSLWLQATRYPCSHLAQELAAALSSMRHLQVLHLENVPIGSVPGGVLAQLPLGTPLLAFHHTREPAQRLPPGEYLRTVRFLALDACFLFQADHHLLAAAAASQPGGLLHSLEHLALLVTGDKRAWWEEEGVEYPSEYTAGLARTRLGEVDMTAGLATLSAVLPQRTAVFVVEAACHPDSYCCAVPQAEDWQTKGAEAVPLVGAVAQEVRRQLSCRGLSVTSTRCFKLEAHLRDMQKGLLGGSAVKPTVQV